MDDLGRYDRLLTERKSVYKVVMSSTKTNSRGLYKFGEEVGGRENNTVTHNNII